MKSIENVVNKGKVLAVIIRANVLNEMKSAGTKVSFATPEHFPLQVGLHSRAKGEIVSAHFHNPFPELRNFQVQEFFYLKSGKVKIDLYDEQENDAKISEIIAEEGDTILLNTGHGITFIENTELIELKQGPYRGKEEEKRFVKGAVR